MTLREADCIEKKNFSEEFTLGTYLGEGGFGVVHNCTRLVDSQQLAVKICGKAMTRDEMRDEANLMQEFRHDNIVQLYGVYRVRGSFYIVMDKYAGGDLTAAM